MGAWGHGSFDNDDAMDWAGMFLEADEGMPDDTDDDDEDPPQTKEVLLIGPLAVLVETPDDEYIDAPVASEALAAAEVIAALFGNPSQELREAAKDASEDNTLGQLMVWVKKTKSQIKSRGNIRGLALDGLDRVLHSELSELWEDSEDGGAAWKQAVEDLRKRLK